MRRWFLSCYLHLLYRVPGVPALVEELYARGYRDGQAAERATLIQDFTLFERDAPPLLH
jgi:hypothetical protein